MGGGLLPGFNGPRLIQLMGSAIERCRLDLRGLVVLTEAASGAYVVTPLLAAMAGARRVYAVTRTTRHGSAGDVRAATMELAWSAGVADRIEVVTELTPGMIQAADIVTNSGHVRPIDAAMIAELRQCAVVPLMYEAWEYRASDVDLAACRRRGIAVAGTNERHRNVDVFSYLGIMAVKLLLDAGVEVHGSEILLVCDNPFAPFIERGLAGAGAKVTVVGGLDQARDDVSFPRLDAILLAAHPGRGRPLGVPEAGRIAARWPGAVLAQFWGDVDREAFGRAGVPCWPERPPSPGHMGILPSGVGPEPIVRLQSGGLKVGEALVRARSGDRAGWEYVDEL
ncbi:MAG: hypothetical protein U0790_18490 [Isosphaeraceae bacterium]